MATAMNLAHLNRSGIYQIANEVTGKFYVGSAVNIRRRWNLHLLHLRRGTHRNRKLQASFAKHGESAFQVSPLEFCDVDVLLAREQHWMNRLNVIVAGYNLNPTAGSGLGQKRPFKNLTVEHRRKIGASKVGRPRSEFSLEWRRKLATAARKRRPKQSERMLAIWASRESKRIVIVCGCGFSREIVKSARAKFSDPYQCRACYLGAARAA